MGTNASSLSGRASVPVALEFFQSRTPDAVHRLLHRYRNKVDSFAADQPSFAAVVGADESPVRGPFSTNRASQVELCARFSRVRVPT